MRGPRVRSPPRSLRHRHRIARWTGASPFCSSTDRRTDGVGKSAGAKAGQGDCSRRYIIVGFVWVPMGSPSTSPDAERSHASKEQQPSTAQDRPATEKRPPGHDSGRHRQTAPRSQPTRGLPGREGQRKAGRRRRVVRLEGSAIAAIRPCGDGVPAGTFPAAGRSHVPFAREQPLSCYRQRRCHPSKGWVSPRSDCRGTCRCLRCQTGSRRRSRH